MSTKFKLFLPALSVVLLPAVTLADDATKIDTGDTAFMLVCSALVLLMTPGLAFFYGGLVRGKNVINTMMMSFIALGIIAVQWVLCGYSIAFSPGSSVVGGLSWLGLNGVGLEPNADYGATIPHQAFMIFQAMFAIITPALISGSIVERMKFKAYIVFILLWGTFAYDVVAHWVWGVGGWLRMLGALDFAGGTVVHINAGVSALVAALMLGARRGFPHKPMPPHNLPLSILGAGLLWFGWFGFNAGSAIASGALATVAFVATNTATAAGVVAWALLDFFIKGKPTGVGIITGAVTGLVAITPACGFVTPVGAIIIGVGAASACYGALNLRVKLNFDDSLDTFSVHGVGGIFGAVMTGILATKSVNPTGNDGLLYGNPSQLWVQLAGVGATIVIAVVVTFVVLKFLDLVMGIRAQPVHEEEGLDLVEHGERGYHMAEEFGEAASFASQLKHGYEAVPILKKDEKPLEATSRSAVPRTTFTQRRPPVQYTALTSRREPPKISAKGIIGSDDKPFKIVIGKIDEKWLLNWWRELCKQDWRTVPQAFKDFYNDVVLFEGRAIVFKKGDPENFKEKIAELLLMSGVWEFEIRVEK